MRHHAAGHYKALEETLAALAATAPAASGWSDNPAPVTLVPDVPTVLTSVTVVPTLTGRFEIVGDAVIDNAGTVVHGTLLDLSLPNGTVLFTGEPIQVPPSPTLTYDREPLLSGSQAAIDWQNQPPTAAFPIGVPVTFQLRAIADSLAGTDLSVQSGGANAGGAQLSVQELPF